MTRRRQTELPGWWAWDFVLTGHVEDRMVDRDFTETDLRRMLEGMKVLRSSHVSGRYIAECIRGRRPWHVVIEPDEANRVVLVVTAYPVDVKR